MVALLKSPVFRKSLAQWTDRDLAIYYVARALGLATPGEPWSYWGGKKFVFWSANPIRRNSLFFTLDKMVEYGVLLKNANGAKYKWNEELDWERCHPG